MTGPATTAALTALCHALGEYLVRLRAAWSTDDSTDGNAEIARLIAATGPQPPPTPASVAVFNGLVARVTSPPTPDEPFTWIADRLNLNLGERLTFAAVWWAETDPQFAVLLGCGHDDGARRHASAALLRLVLTPFGLNLPPSWESDARLVRLGVLEPHAGPGGPLRLTSALRTAMTNPHLTSPHLAHPHLPNPHLAEAHLRTTPKPRRPQRQPGSSRSRAWPRRARRTSAVLAQVSGLLVEGGAVLLRGAPPPRSGAEAAARGAGRRVLAGAEYSDAELRLLGRLDAGVPVVDAERLDGLGWTDDDGPLLAVGEPGCPAYGAHPVDVPRTPPGERAASWRRALLLAGLPPIAARHAGDQLGTRLVLEDGEIGTAVRQAVREAETLGRELEAGDVWRVARRLPQHDLRRVAALVEPAFTLDDLVVGEEVRAQLDEVVAHVSLQDMVLDRWGFRRRLPRGQGVAVLMSGPPGTGKTMAAEALARALDQDLYRIDLSAVVSKYIGETEKNLALAFDEAERAAAVLFFDECDAMFGRRTEQRDAHDRWANLEINYLLQRVESFTGLVVLATNRRQALDEAFQRRLRFSIRFETPDLAQRQELWRRSFPRALPREEFDAGEFATRELAGGSVQNVALAAAFRAAADGGRLRREHVIHALRHEYQKLGKVWTED